MQGGTDRTSIYVWKEDNGLLRSTELIARSCDAARTYYHCASDEMGSTTHIIDEAGQVQNRYEYDAWGNIVGVEDGNRNRTQYRLDTWGRIVGVVKADGSTGSYSYACS